MATLDAKLQAECEERSQPGLVALMKAFLAIFPKMAGPLRGCDFALMDSKTAWAVTYTNINICEMATHTVTVRRYDRALRKVTIRGSETFETLDDALIFATEIARPTDYVRYPADSPEHAKEDIKIIARGAIHHHVLPAEAEIDQRVFSTLCL